MKVLFVCCDHYPYAGACTSLLEKMFHAGNLTGAFSSVSVLTLKKSEQEPDFETANGVSVYRCFAPSALKKREALRLLVKRPLFALSSLFCKAQKYIVTNILKKTLFLKADYKRVLLKKLREIKNEGFDVIVPVCGAFETGAATLAFLRECSVPMVVYQVDPLVANRAFSGVSPRRVAAFEEALFSAAKAVVTTPLLFKDLSARYAKDAVKKFCAMEFPNVSPEEPCGETVPFSCVFAGAIYPQARNPAHTLRLFSRMQDPRIRLHFIGAAKEQLEEYVDFPLSEERFVFHGRVPLNVARAEIAKAEILVNVGNIMTNQVPSKIFEYISACKPIVNVCTSAECPSLGYLKDYPLAISVVEGEGTVEEQAAEVEAFLLRYAGERVEKALVLSRFAACTANYCAEQMKNVLYAAAENG